MKSARVASPIAVATAIVIVAALPPAYAKSGGIFGQARQGCGSGGNALCHIGGNLPQTTQVEIVGLSDQGYTPGQTYPITVGITGFGISLGPSPTLVDNAKGFGLEISASQDQTRSPGLLDPAVQNDPTLCVGPPKLTGGELVFCPGEGTQATHQCPARDEVTNICTGLVVTDDGTGRSEWHLLWTAPTAGTGPIDFYLAGNAVNLNGSPDFGDR